MRKNELIRMLQTVPGNPEVLLYNGLVNDWQRIAVGEDTLYAYKKKVVQQLVQSQRMEDARKRGVAYEPQAVSVHKRDWTLDGNDHYTVAESRKIHDTKRVVLLGGRRRGKKTFDRSGTIEY